MGDNKTYNCLIIDDEPVAISVIQEHLEAFKNFSCIKGFTRPVEATELLSQGHIDLLFLDINMPGISGIDFLRTLTNPPAVILTTAYRDFAVDAFDLNVLDYLLKPISFERFLKSINKFLKQTAPPPLPHNTQDADSTFILLKADKKIHRMEVADIVFAESLDNYIIVTTSHQKLICYESLSHLEDRLPTHDFLRIHRSFLINVNKITAFTSAHLEINDRKFNIGRNYKETVIKRLLNSPSD
jgi:DNA-binding LytR/AlgR family response regulator